MSFKAYQPGGPSSGLLPASLDDVPLDFDTLQPHGSFIGSAAVVVLSDQDSAREAALNMLRFFEDESCGQCTPCRVGCEKAVKLMQAERWDAAAAGGALPGDGGRLDLRAGAGGAEPDPAGDEALSRRGRGQRRRRRAAASRLRHEDLRPRPAISRRCARPRHRRGSAARRSAGPAPACRSAADA